MYVSSGQKKFISYINAICSLFWFEETNSCRLVNGSCGEVCRGLVQEPAGQKSASLRLLAE